MDQVCDFDSIPVSVYLSFYADIYMPVYRCTCTKHLYELFIIKWYFVMKCDIQTN